MALPRVFVVIADDAIYVCDGKRSLPNRRQDGTPLTTEIAAAVEAFGSGKFAYGLAIPSTYFYYLSSEGRGDRNETAEQRKYELEQQLPLDAESMAIVELQHKQRSETVVLNTEKTDDLLKTLCDEYEIYFDMIVPKSLVVGKYFTAKQPSACVVVDSRTADFVGQVEAESTWQYLPNVADLNFNELDESVRIAMLNEPVAGLADRHSIVSCDQVLLECFGSANAISLIESLDFSDQANASAAIAKASTSTLEYLLLGVVIAMLLCSIAFSLRASSLRTSLVGLENETRQDYRKLFEGERINGPIKRLLDAKLEMARQVNGLVEFSNHTPRVLKAFSSVLQKLPANAKYRLSSIEVFSNRILLAGKVDSLSDLDNLREQLVAAGYEIDDDRKYAVDFTLALIIPDGFGQGEAE